MAEEDKQVIDSKSSPEVCWKLQCQYHSHISYHLFSNTHMCIKRREIVDRQLKNRSIWFNWNNTLTENKINKRLLISITLPAKLLLKVFLLLKSVWLSSNYLSLWLMSTQTARYLYLYYLEAHHFCPLVIGIQSPVPHFIPIWQFI